MTAFSDEVRQIVSPHKFGGSRRAAAAYLVDLDGCADEVTGDTCDWQFYAARIGRRVLIVDDQGFVDCERYVSEVGAVRRFDAIAADYGAHLDNEEQVRDLRSEGFTEWTGSEPDDFKPGDAVRVEGYNGIAFRVLTVPTRKGPDSDWTGYLYANFGRRVCYMVGDDREFVFDVDELTPLDEDDFCGGCGQIGCGWC